LVVFGSAVPARGQDPVANAYDPDAASCPLRVIFYLESGSTQERYVGYAVRGADAFFSPVFYTFSNVKSASGKHTASGNFYVYGIECRLATWLSWNGVMSPPPWRYEFVETQALACNRDTRLVTDVTYEPYDPDYGGSDDCGGSGSGGGGDGGSGAGSGSGCRTEYVYVEVSHDGGATWVTYWEGYATVCG
jgi:hypothetical protein